MDERRGFSALRRGQMRTFSPPPPFSQGRKGAFSEDSYEKKNWNFLPLLRIITHSFEKGSSASSSLILFSSTARII